MHHQTLTSFKCHLCSNTAQTTDLLIDHYKTHGYFKYHCVYCTIGAPTVKELHNHLSTAHYNQPPHILERCLPREIEKNVSAIDQLKVRDVDVMYRTRKGVDNDIKIPMPPLIKAPSNTVSLMTADQSIPTAKLIMPKESINSKSFVPLANLDGTVSNIRILESWNFKNSNNPNIINFRPNIKVSMADKSTPKNDQVTFRVLNDDGINTKRLNLFEQKSLLSKQAKNTNVNQGTDSDSDIEIIEEVSNSKSSNRKDLAGKIKEEVTETKVSEPKLEPIEDSPASSRASQSVEEASQSDGNDRFLTLDDVKDTGLTGHELYRCGIENCKFSAENAEDLRAHMLQCSPIDDEFSDSTALYCVHCGPGTKRFSKYSFYIDHIKTHGLKRYKCDLCKAKFSMQSHAQTHLRTKHKYVTSKIVPVDPDNQYPELGLFIVYPMTKKLLKLPDKEVKQTSENEKSSYAPNEIDKLPLQPIYNRALQCAVCSYSNKVRTNLMRHLQAHLEGESVPETGPVNPVPCLEKNEKMFDKMVNLASSSHENGRMGGGGPANYPLKDAAQLEQEDAVPKFVPESKRYVCGVLECNYLTVEEGMLRYHYRGLHSDETNYRCPHCPEPTSQESQQNVALDKMGNHLKMHDSRLYKCSHCIYHHYQRHVVERHLADKHPEKRQFVKVIRELNSEQAQAAADEKEKEMSAKSDVVPEPEEQEEQPDPDGNNWKCCMCDFKCVLKQAMQSHASSVHDEKCQFKCNGCSYKCVSKATFDQHLLTKHMLEPNIEYTTVYRKIKFQAKKTEAVETTTTPQAEPFDTTPLWMRNMPRVRHIRGILLEEEEPGKGGKRKSDADGPPKPAKAKPSKSSAQDESRTPEAKKNRNSVDSPSDVKLPDTSITSYGVPVGDFYVCTICTQYKTKYKSDFRDHICRDLKYFKWLCRICDYKSVNRQGLVKHISSRHLGETVDDIQQETNDQIEEWVNLVVKTQSDIMKANKSTDAPDPAPENEEADESEDDDLIIETKEENEENDASEEERDYEVLGSPLSCKHCAKVFAKWRGFKRHVQLKHLQRLGYLCPYCDRSSNSEAIILQHVKSSHQGMTAVAVSNTNLSAPDLTPEFWEREYGLVVPKRAKKRKRREENSDEIRSEFVCDKCDFISHSLAGFKSHLKKHETKIKQKCVYCSFSSFNASEMRQHWEVNHLQHEFRVEEAIVSSAVMEANTRQVKKTKFEDEKKAIVYYCYYCDVRSTALESIRSHWRLVHKDEEKSSIFKYKEHSEPGAKCAYCAEAGSKSTLINHIHEVHGADKPILLVERDEDGWMCRWCLEVFFTTKEEIDQHHKIYHSHLRRDYQLTRRVFNCRRCNKFDTISLETMQKHARTHLNFKCKFCKEVFGAFYLVKAHYKSDHPDKESEHRSINSDEVHQKQVDDIVTESSVFSSVHLTPLPISPAKSPPTSPRLAKKSTTKQILTVVRPYPGKIKAVARKSTNPLPRYPPGIVFDIEERDSPRSYYGRAASPIDLNSLSTTITAGGFKMKANCAKLAELFNINISPTLKIVDFIKERRKKRS